MTDPDRSFERDLTPPRRRWRRWLVAVIGIGLLAVIAALALHEVRSRAATESAAIVALRGEIDSLRAAMRAADSARAALERRIAGAEGVNRSMREELLGAGERASALEDAVTRLARRGLTGSTELKLNEAEFLLSMGEERLTLFGDVAGALRALDLADAELAALDDPIYAGVRQSLAIEREALRALPAADAAALFAELDALSDAIATLPDAPASGTAAGTDAVPVAETSFVGRIGQGLTRFIRIERTDSAAGTWVHPDSARLSAQVDLLRAKSALALGDRDGMATAVARTRDALGPWQDGNPEHEEILDRLETLASSPVLTLPPVGGALQQLRNLRMTRSMVLPPDTDEASR
jgi:uroporphyrin-3 C-methyltransferase